MAPSVTLRPPQPSVIGRATPTSPDGQPARTNSPRRPELRLTIDSPRSTSPLVGAAPSPRGPRASPGTIASAGVLSPRLAGESTLRPSSKGEGGSATLTPSGIQRSSSFARRGDNEWALRPPPEQLYENLDDFFPRHDLDKPVLDLTSGAPGAAGAGGAAASPTRAASPSHASSPTSANALARHKKSIRRVAQDRVRGAGLGGLAMTSAVGPAASSSSAAQAPPRASSDLARRPSTKLWGTKLLEVTPGHEQSASGSSSASSSSSSSASSSNRPVFKWVKGDLIGKGTYGRVYIALNATTGEMIAVKQVELPTTEHDRCDARQRDVVAALKSEISTLKDLDHPHIVSYLGFEETPEFLHLFLEYVPGGSIASVLRKYGKLEEGIIKYFVHQVLSGLSYLHERGVLHRDLKGDNLLVNLDGTVKISDFGTMRKSDDIYADVAGMSLQGSVFWMAPEVVLLTKKGYSAKVDIWSLGCVTLEMFAGRRPWSDDEAVQAMFKIGKEGRAPPVPPDVRLSREAAHFLRNCFFIDPNDRPTAARLLDHVFPDVPGGWSFEETRLWRMMQRSLQNRAAGAR
ncbi:Pkinase-domain-containing protein [Jaminaea rosea]|uniref:Pkinase-domain-containing protein n=1 Tax=Jaminaea rosea TaxID=1569628 RepID=A0A316UJE5_9BASI|nr:Pkinase-domain-containing protein [Jaminaea rosea]PWN24461.1 Pkinase-domain-containing protein [Jaminaea rosea]